MATACRRTTRRRQWFRKAADQGGARAGRPRPDVRPRPRRAAGQRAGPIWFRKAADRGTPSRSQPRRDVRKRQRRGAGLRTGRRWYRKAADQGNADAQNNLGWMYHNGQGVPQDYAQAVAGTARPPTRGTPMRRATSADVPNGRGVPQDYAQAIAWYRKAADQGNADAQNNLG